MSSSPKKKFTIKKKKEDIKEKYRKKGKEGIWIETHSGQVVYHLFEMNFG